MKKVRLFAVAAAMGMFASTVAAAEPVVTTGYTTTWEGVEEIIKVDVGNKVVAPVTTIKVVKETRTTDSEYDVTSDALGFDTEANCWTSTGVAEDENGDNYSDAQVYFNKLSGSNVWNDVEVGYFYSSRTEALTDYLVRNNLVLAPNAEAKEEVFYSPVLGQYFADLEEVYNFLEEKGLVETVYDEDGDFEAVYVNAKTITDKKGNELAKARTEIKALDIRKPELKTKEAVAAKLIGYDQDNAVNTNVTALEIDNTVLYNYVSEKTNTKFSLPFAGTWEHDVEVNGEKVYEDDIPTGSIVIVEENKKGELEIVTVVKATSTTTPATATGYTYAGWTAANGVDDVDVTGENGKVLVVELVDEGEVSKLATVSPTKVGRFTPFSTMVWDEEVGSFAKTTNGYVPFDVKLDAAHEGYWDTYAYEYDEEAEEGNNPERLTEEDLEVSGVFGINRFYEETLENPTDKWVLLSRAGLKSINSKENKITLSYGTNGKDITVNAVELDDEKLYPAFDSLETLVKVAAKLDAYEYIGVNWADDENTWGIEVDGTPDGYKESSNYTSWYTATKALADNPWSGFELDFIPKNEMRGTGSEACSYVVSVSSEEVTATVEASEVDTTEAGVKTMTLSAKVDGEVVATKNVKVVVAPRYERTYVNGKVAVLKSFYLDGTLYSEYHYDWAAKTYTATFYANDGVTVASTANGTL